MAPVGVDFVVVISKKVFFYLSHLLDVIVFVCLKVSKKDSMRLIALFLVLQSCSRGRNDLH